VAVDGNAFEDGAADNRVQSGAVAAAGEDSDFHFLHLVSACSEVSQQGVLLSTERVAGPRVT
jgi:hypothetical protein